MVGRFGRADRSSGQNALKFGYSGSGEEPAQIGLGECGLLGTEVAGGFTGVFIAMYATGNGIRSASPAHFDWFDYRPAE